MRRPLLIGIGGSHSGAGKTTLACLILRHFTARRRSLSSTLRWGAVKYTQTGSAPAITDDPRILCEEGKDTARLLAAGASEVLWLRTRRDGLARAIPQTLRRLSGCDAVVIEGNGAIEFSQPDIVVFIFGNNATRWKAGCERFAAHADIVIFENRSALPESANPNRRLIQGNIMVPAVRRRFLRTLGGLIRERTAEG